MSDRLLYRPEEAADVLAISRSQLFELLGRGEIKSLKIGASRRITREALEDYVGRLAALCEPDMEVPGPAPPDPGADHAAMHAGPCPKGTTDDHRTVQHRLSA